MGRTRRIFISFMLMLPALTSGATDTLKIHLIFKHKLDSTGHSAGRMVVNQKLYSPDGVLFREVNYDEKTGQRTGYIFYFYRNGRLFTREFYSNSDSLMYIQKYEYDKSGNENIITTLIPGAPGWITTARTDMVFDNSHRKIQQKKYVGRKPGEVASYEYNDSGQLIRETIKYRPAAQSANREESRSFTYSSNNQLKQMTVTGIDALKRPFSYSEAYGYNDKGWLTEVKLFNAAQEVTGFKIYQYRSEGSIGVYEERNASGLTFVLLEYDYRIHPLDTGIQVSRYEDF